MSYVGALEPSGLAIAACGLRSLGVFRVLCLFRV